jgi:glycerate dehydrogenase
MKLVILDGYTLNPGDLSWDELRILATCEIHDRTPEAAIVARAAGAEVVLTNKTPLSAETIAQLPRLRYIGVLATGYNVVDIAAARARSIVVTNVPTYGTRSVAQHVFALVLEFTTGVGHHAQTVREGRWSHSIDWCYWDQPLIELEGLTLGVVGYGRIGRAVAGVGAALGMRVVATDVADTPGAERVPLEELLQRSDVVSLHCPLTAETQGLINRARLGLMKPTALLVNTARGPLVVDADLAAALNEGRLGGAALDVLSVEPPAADNPLLTARNCLITPHIAWAARASRQRLLGIAVANLRAFIGGSPVNVVS